MKFTLYIAELNGSHGLQDNRRSSSISASSEPNSQPQLVRVLYNVFNQKVSNQNCYLCQTQLVAEYVYKALLVCSFLTQSVMAMKATVESSAPSSHTRVCI